MDVLGWLTVRRQIIAAHKAGKNNSEIARELQRDRGFTRRVITEWEKAGSPDDWPIVTGAEQVHEMRTEPIATQPVEPATDYKDAIVAAIKKQPLSLDEIASRVNCTRGQVLDVLDRLPRSGVNLHQFGERYSIEKAPQLGRQHSPERFKLTTEPNGEIIIGLIADTHNGSKYARVDVQEELYDMYKAAGAQYVLHAGNWIEGEARFNKFDLLPEAHGMTGQVELFIKQYPKRDGIVTRFIDGDDHEGWYSQREGVEVGRYCEMKAREAGRTDLEYLSYMEAWIDVVHGQTGESSKLLLCHPGGGSSYAISYTSQKLVESFQGGEKPAVLCIGHYHKALYAIVRNVHTIQVPCTKDQDVFGRKKRLEYVIGGINLRLKLNKSGAVERCLPEFRLFFNRGYHQNQWSMTGDVTHAPLEAAA